VNSYQVWSAGVARRAIQPGVRTANPTPAAKQLLGKKLVRTAIKRLKKKGRKSAHRGNPIPAIAATIGGPLVKNILGGTIAERLQSPGAHQAARVAWADQHLAAGKAHLDAGDVTGAKIELQLLYDQAGLRNPGQFGGTAIGAATKEARDYIQQQYNLLKAAIETRPGQRGNVTPGQELGSLLTSPGGQLIAREAARAAFRRPRRQRYPSYMDRYGRQRYSYRPPGSQMRLPAGAVAAAGTPYNFFTGAVGRGSGLQTAGQLAVAGAAGVGAYLVTKRLLEYLGGRAQSKEEAGVSAARALHQSLEDYKQQHGQYPPPAERQRMKEAYRAKLVELGYDPDTFQRTRSGVEQFLETYNPFGG
jgi:hypothetical protein